MFKVIEIHIGYLSSLVTIIAHILIAFYALYILKTSMLDYSKPERTDKKIIWYKTPTVTEQPVHVSPQYKMPPLDEKVITLAETTPSQQPPEKPLDRRLVRSRQEQQAAWKRAAREPEASKAPPLTAATLLEALSQELASQRKAQAVYTKQQALEQRVAAHMREITEGRLRNKLFSALKIAFDNHKKDFYSPVPIMSTFDISIVLNQQGEIIAVEVLRSTGTATLDKHLIETIQSVKKMALPPSATGKEFYSITFSSKVTIHAGSGHIIFDYKDASGIHIV